MLVVWGGVVLVVWGGVVLVTRGLINICHSSICHVACLGLVFSGCTSITC